MSRQLVKVRPCSTFLTMAKAQAAAPVYCGVPHPVNCLLLNKAPCAQSLFSPIAGVLGDRVNRKHIIVFGCLCWAVFTLLFGFARHFVEVRPVSQAAVLFYASEQPGVVLHCLQAESTD